MNGKPQNNDEKQLLLLIARGDQEAFAVIYNKYSERIASYIATLLHSELWVEEIVQDVFVKLWTIRDTLPEISNLSAFIYRMAANRTWDHLKRQALELKFQYRLARQTEGDHKNFTEEQLDFQLSKQLLKKAVGSLPPQRRLIYQLKQEQGMSYVDIAKKLGISKNTVRNQIIAALNQIRTYMTKTDRLLSILSGFIFVFYLLF